MRGGIETSVGERVPVESLNDLEEITAWVGTYKERLRLARGAAKDTHAAEIQRLSDRLQQRRAELA